MKDFFEENHFNLSDFAFFLSVMKDKRARRDVLSIILNEEDLEKIRSICEAALPYAPEFDLDKVCDACRSESNL